MSSTPNWWMDAVFYEVYVRSFADSNADGVGDLAGARSRLGYLELLGVDALWITPFYRSPMADHGYDVADPRDVDPVFGDLEAFDALVTSAHEHGMRITIDLVPNHSSMAHEWFQAALTSAPGSPERARYHFRDGSGPDGDRPPNNWHSVFGGPAWTRVAGQDGPGQWYLHLFAPEQPDLNWENPEVWADLDKTVHFWLDRGVDGFRIDVAHGMAKPEGLPDSKGPEVGLLGSTSGDDGPGKPAGEGSGDESAHGGDVDDPEPAGQSPAGHQPAAVEADDPRFDNDGAHDVHRMIRAVLDEYPGRMAVGEIWVRDDERFANYVRPDELHLGFNFRLIEAAFDAQEVRAAIEHSLAAVALAGATPTWTLSNHDVPRQVTRYGGGATGLRRARAMVLVELALPGTVYLYNGEELGLPNVELPDDALRDPLWERSGHTDRGRDGCRIPVPWENGPPGFGFTDSTQPWLPIPTDWSALSVEAQLEDPDSMLSLYRQALELRQRHPGFAGEELEWFGAPPGCFAFRRAGSTLVCALNTSTDTVPLPPGDLLLSSAELVDGQLPPGTAAWLA